MDEFDALNQSFSASDWPDHIRIEHSDLGGPVVRLSTPGGAATIALWGGQVLSWCPTGHQEALWLSPAARLDGGKPVRGGIPVCWPWFGPHPQDPTSPAHGVARTMLWDVCAGEAEADFAEISLMCQTVDENGRPLAPEFGGPPIPVLASLELRVRLDSQLKLSLLTRNLSADTLELTQALHTYFLIGDIATVSVLGVDEGGYIDKVAGEIRSSQPGPVHFDGEFDRIYDAHVGTARVVDPTMARQITVQKSGSRSTVVWNPGPVKAARLGDVPGDSYRHMLCVETANAGADVIRLAPRQSHELSATFGMEHG